MNKRNNGLITNCCSGLLLLNWIISINVQAAITTEQVAALVEALRLAAPKQGNLHSEWQIKAPNIYSWSQRCLGRTLTTEEFGADPELARAILECKMGGVLREQYELSHYDEATAIQRTAAWWLTGVTEPYQNDMTTTYTQKVLNLYYQQLKNTPPSPSLEEQPTTSVPITLPPTPPIPTPPVEEEPQTPPSLTPHPTPTTPTSPGVTDKQIKDLVEALRLAAPKHRNSNDNLYSEWQVKPADIRRWSRTCLQQELTPAEFEADPQTSRTILTCKLGELLNQEYTASNQDIFVAVRRVAAWWLTGDSHQYKTGAIGDYTLKVLEFYLQL